MDITTILLWAFLNVLPLSDAITCSEIAQCEYDSQTYANAQADGDIAALCSLLGKSVECMETAMDDCERNSNFPENRLQQVQQGLEMHKKQVKAFCPRSDDPIVKTSDSEGSSVGSAKRKHGLADVPVNPTCTEIMTCMFDLQLFKKALTENRLTEACGLINPSVKCLQFAIKDCKDNRFMDNEDLANATHSLTDAEKLLENYCGYIRENENTKTGKNPEATDGKPADGHKANQTKSETKTQEYASEARAKEREADSGYKTLNESNKKNTSASSNSGNNNIIENGRHNGASVQTISLGVLCLLLVLNIEGLNNYLLHKVLYADIVSSF